MVDAIIQSSTLGVKRSMIESITDNEIGVIRGVASLAVLHQLVVSITMPFLMVRMMLCSLL